jgi:hypothetical protein
MAGQKKSSKPAVSVGSRILWRPKVWGALAVLVAIGLGGQIAWQHFGPEIARRPQFLITADGIHISPPPPWVHSDIRAEVLRDSGLIGNLSVLEDGPALQQRARDAFAFHPWVKSVKRIVIGLPASLEVELEYRRPVAAVEATDGDAVTFLPVDASGVRLPEGDFNDVERRYLPRISGVTGRPVAGKTWGDPRVVDAAMLAAGLSDIWNELRLVEIVPSPQMQVRGESRYFTFDIVTSGGTRVVWGAARGQERDAAESPFDIKRKRLLDYASQQGHLDSVDGPAEVDVRIDLKVTARTARRPAESSEQATETK